MDNNGGRTAIRPMVPQSAPAHAAPPSGRRVLYNIFYLNRDTDDLEFQVLEVDEAVVEDDLMDAVYVAWGSHAAAVNLSFLCLKDQAGAVVFTKKGFAIYTNRVIAQSRRAILAEATA